MRSAMFILCLCFHIAVMAQSPVPVDTLVEKFDHYRKHNLQEKLYAHLDRNFYLTGETLWFKLYCVDATLHKPLDLSKVAYVEVLDKSNFPVLRTKVRLQEGTGNGSFFLPASLTSGNYRFRAYTSWMKNFSPDFFYSETIALVNPFIIPEPSGRASSVSSSIEFFPEGGNLVAGVRSKVAYRITNGHRLKKGGIILKNAAGDTIASLVPGTNGLGHFYITPSSTYTTVLIGNAITTSQKFPEVFPSGVVMELQDSSNLIRIITTTRGVPDQSLYLFAHARQRVVKAQAAPLRDHQAVFQIRKDELPPGISHFTIFNEQLEPLCERLFFNYPDHELGITIKTNQKTYAPRKKITVSLHATANGLNSRANLSLAVYKLDSLTTRKQMTIHPFLWLGSELPGVTGVPQEYFSPEQAADMDHLMLTQGWRRFNWKDILGEQRQMKFLPEVREHIVTGVITKEGKPQSGVFTYLGSPGRIIRAYGSWSNASGEIRFEIKDFYGPRRIILQSRADSTKNYHIEVKDPFSSSPSSHSLDPLVLPEESSDALIERSIAMQVQDIFYYEQFGEQTIPPLVDSTAFYGPADNTYYLDDYTRFPVMEEVMREYVPGVFVRKRRDGFHFIVLDQVNGGVLPGDPMVLLDGVPILDVDNIMNMDPLRIKKLEVVKRQYYLGQAVFSGIVSYTTYNGDLSGLELDPQSVSLNYDGLQLKRQFHSPQYSLKTEHDRLPDQRYLLHWEPIISADEFGQYQLEFYTSDVPGKYAIVVEGLNENGYSGTETYEFTVSDSDTP